MELVVVVADVVVVVIILLSLSISFSLPLSMPPKLSSPSHLKITNPILSRNFWFFLYFPLFSCFVGRILL